MSTEYENHLLSSARLKDRAKGILEGNYIKPIGAFLLIGTLTLAAQIVVEFIASFLFSTVIIARELSTSGLTADQLIALLEQTSYLEEYSVYYAPIEYVAQTVMSVFTSVFQVGFSLICLNMACKRPLRIADIFYGFRTQPGKSLRISAVFVLAAQCYLIPLQFVTYFIRHNGSARQIGGSACFLAIGVAVYLPMILAISQSYLLLLDMPDYSATEIIKLSIRIMKGQKLRLFLLQLSFLPMILLSFLSLGIGNLWLTPYMEVTYTVFFLNLMHARNSSFHAQ